MKRQHQDTKEKSSKRAKVIYRYELSIINIQAKKYVIILRSDGILPFSGGLKNPKSEELLIEHFDELQKITLKLFKEYEIFLISPLRNYKSIYDKFIKEEIKCDPIPEPILTCMFKEKVDIENKLYNLKSFNSLYSYQKEGVEFIIRNNGKGMIADEMGLGKTYQALVILDYYKCKTLIICPASLQKNWRNEHKKFLGKDINIAKGPKEKFEENTIVTFGRAKLVSQLNNFDLIIIDESHNIKSIDAKQTKSILKLTAKTKYVLELTGTPGDKSMEFFSQFKALDSKRWKNFFTKPQYQKKETFYFAKRYCDPSKIWVRGKAQYKHNGSTRPWELNCIKSIYIIRRKKEVATNLPPKVRNYITIGEVNQTEEMKFIDNLQDRNKSMQAQCELMKLVQQTSIQKQCFIIDYISKLDFSNGEKHGFFFHFVETGNYLEKALQHLSYIKIDGSVPVNKRQTLVDEFQNEKQIAILSIRAAGTGLNLYNGRHIHMIDLTWSNKDSQQCESRFHRNGCTKQVNVNYLILKGSTDEIMWRTLNKKELNSNLILENKRSYLFVNRL
jgi:SWI/SNF-related matrix-associated actin-dependent regulator 1 of chromatin subfamily A